MERFLQCCSMFIALVNLISFGQTQGELEEARLHWRALCRQQEMELYAHVANNNAINGSNLIKGYKILIFEAEPLLVVAVEDVLDVDDHELSIKRRRADYCPSRSPVFFSLLSGEGQKVLTEREVESYEPRSSNRRIGPLPNEIYVSKHLAELDLSHNPPLKIAFPIRYLLGSTYGRNWNRFYLLANGLRIPREIV
ncbi:hypothetical protein F2Q69_00025104 [Brassica cretica]|uniref:Inhibitor I9 domain-containing protein n=1 Tax=Brassica cretica TaxID=69181 RepID=A0A8S9QJ12_BRACR|nr:hypothetical protein F2Q69_00025104 [Brassica cretica]